MKRINTNTIILAVIILATTISILIFVYGLSVTNRYNEIETHWSEFTQQSIQKTKVLSRIQHQLGYGGFIHNFKNYLIRHDKTMLPTIKKNQKDLLQALAEFQALPITDNERAAIQKLQHVVQIYINKFELSQQLFHEGISTEPVGQRMRVNDNEALKAINYLESSGQKEPGTKTAIINIKRFTLWGLLIFPIIFFAALIVVLMLRRLFISNQIIIETNNHLDTLLDQSPDATLSVDSDGKILRANQQALKLFGYESEELLSLQVESINT